MYNAPLGFFYEDFTNEGNGVCSFRNVQFNRESIELLEVDFLNGRAQSNPPGQPGRTFNLEISPV